MAKEYVMQRDLKAQEEEIEKIAKNIEIIDLSKSTIFQEEFIENIGFWDN